MEKVSLTIDNIKVEVDKNLTILEAARVAGIEIPTLCYLKEVNEIAACRVCIVEIEGARSLQASCVHPVAEGMIIKTSSQKVRSARKSTVELILSAHNRECLTCSRNKSCELQNVANDLGISEIKYQGAGPHTTIDESSTAIVRDQTKCILCGKCVSACKNVQQVGVLDFTLRGIETIISTSFNADMADTPCIHCGNCISVCPVAALKEKNNTKEVWDALENDDLHVVVQTAPAVRAALGEEFGLEIGTAVTGKLVSALKRLGFNKVYDTTFGADLTIMEEGNELLDRINNGGKLPMITSCCPGWVRFCEFYYPEFIPNLSSCKSPQQMTGAIIKNYYASANKIDPKKIFSVSVMPCIAKKSECARDEQKTDAGRDVDVVITTKELAQMIKEAGIDFARLPDTDYDHDLLGDNTGAGVIFGITGGVMEASIRTVAEILEGKELDKIEYDAVRGLEGIREATVELGDKKIRVALAHGTANASKLLDKIKAGEADYDFIEIMACSGGCINGGGQPYITMKDRHTKDICALRGSVLYSEDQKTVIRKSHKSPVIKKLYADYLGEPNGKLAHDLLHTHYSPKDKYTT